VNAPLLQRNLLTLAPLDGPTSRALLAAARALRQTAGGAAPLRGKNIALMCSNLRGDRATESAGHLFADAAASLGARVARIEPAPAWMLGEAQPGADTARLLQHLYDAVDCEALPAGFATQLQSLLEVPVYNSLASEDHPMFALLGELVPSGRAPAAADRRVLVQAALVSTLL
jgi:ornithine carbamoyltransferase